jgi:hypothetical protein
MISGPRLTIYNYQRGAVSTPSSQDGAVDVDLTGNVESTNLVGASIEDSFLRPSHPEADGSSSTPLFSFRIMPSDGQLPVVLHARTDADRSRWLRVLHAACGEEDALSALELLAQSAVAAISATGPVPASHVGATAFALSEPLAVTESVTTSCIQDSEISEQRDKISSVSVPLAAADTTVVDSTPESSSAPLEIRLLLEGGSVSVKSDADAMAVSTMPVAVFPGAIVAPIAPVVEHALKKSPDERGSAGSSAAAAGPQSGVTWASLPSPPPSLWSRVNRTKVCL